MNTVTSMSCNRRRQRRLTVRQTSTILALIGIGCSIKTIVCFHVPVAEVNTNGIRRINSRRKYDYRMVPSNVDKNDDPIQEMNRKRNIPRKIVQIYSDYASRLWKETSLEGRQRLGRDQLVSSIRQVQRKLKSIAAASSSALQIPTKSNDDDDDRDYINIAPNVRENLLNACDEVLNGLQSKKRETKATTENEYNGLVATIAIPSTLQNKESAEVNGLSNVNVSVNTVTAVSVPLPNGEQSLAEEGILSVSNGYLTSDHEQQKGNVVKQKKTRSVAFGALMGAVVALWVFSGNYIFTGLFTLMTILGQLEYYRMIMNTGTYPARRISVLGACSMFVSALLCPDLHQICLPAFGLWTMVWFLTMKREVSTIAEIATTFTGMFYLGYVPSFWVRIRLLGPSEPTRLAPVVAPILNLIRSTAEQAYILPKWAPQAIHLPITTGSVFIFWTWLSLAFSDVGAYFVGKKFGKTKLHVISPAAGATSPNKTVEGVIGGCIASAMLAIVGAWVQRWPFPLVTGTIHGVLLGILGLIGDLTASMLKRDAGLKDFGDLLPEHGGILDRVDSFIWSAPYSWLVCAYIIPTLKQIFR